MSDKTGPQLIASWMTNHLFRKLTESKIKITESPVSPQQLGQLVYLIQSKFISDVNARKIFEIMWEKGGHPAQIMLEQELFEVNKDSEIEKIVDTIISENIDKFNDAKTKPNLIGWFVGQVLKSSKGLNPKRVKEIFEDRINK